MVSWHHLRPIPAVEQLEELDYKAQFVSTEGAIAAAIDTGSLYCRGVSINQVIPIFMLYIAILHCTLGTVLESPKDREWSGSREWVRENGLREWSPPCGFLLL
jgi:hypothetical protein